MLEENLSKWNTQKTPVIPSMDLYYQTTQDYTRAVLTLAPALQCTLASHCIRSKYAVPYIASASTAFAQYLGLQFICNIFL